MKLLAFPFVQEAHPSWTGGTLSGQQGVEPDSTALIREQDLHRVAAARQLETLEKIEEGNGSEVDQDIAPTIDEAYIPIPPGDAPRARA
jgi:hypothetical protein